MRTHHLTLTLALTAAALASGCWGTHPWCNKWCAPRPAIAAAVPAPGCCPPGTAPIPGNLPPAGLPPAGLPPAGAPVAPGAIPAFPPPPPSNGFGR